MPERGKARQKRSKFAKEKQSFRFPNAFDVHDAISNPLLKRVIGDNPVLYGLCGGMCFAALDYYLADQPTPDVAQIPKADTSLYRYLRSRQKDSMSFAVLRKLVLWMIKDDEEIARLTAQEEIPRLLRSLDSGMPMVLVMVRVGIGNPTLNHQVLAADYEYDESSRQLIIELYDPNHPGKTPELHFDLTDPTQIRSQRQTTGEAFRGFFVTEDYNHRPPPMLIEGPPFGDNTGKYA